MLEMTISRLDNYFVWQKQKELFEIKYIPSSISGVDTSKPAVQSNSISNTTENQAIQRLDIDPTIKAEYSRVCRELKVLNDYIYSIPDETIRAIAVRRFVLKQSYKTIGYIFHYSKGSVYRMLVNYIEKGNKGNKGNDRPLVTP